MTRLLSYSHGYLSEIPPMSEIATTEAAPSRVNVYKMFDRIAGKYDTLNRLLSLRRDVAWRKAMVKFLPDGDSLRHLDLATGTGDQILFMMKETNCIQESVGVDLSEGMLEVGRKKIAASPWADRIRMETGDALNIPVEDGGFDVTTISFGIRNVIHVPQAMQEMLRVLKPGGRALILECSLPPNPLLRKLYLFYFRHFLPWVGGVVSGNTDAYKYLNRTVETFPSGQAFCEIMREAGFEHVNLKTLTFGVATIYMGDKPGNAADASPHA